VEKSSPPKDQYDLSFDLQHHWLYLAYINSGLFTENSESIL